MKKLKLRKIITSTLVIASVFASNPIGASAEWKQDNQGWRYSEGNSWAMGWRNVSGNWYYFDQNGYMLKNTLIQGWKLDSNGIGSSAKETANIVTENSIGNSNGNLSNYGLAAIKDDYIYYINNDGNSKTSAIDRIKTDGTGKETLISKYVSTNIFNLSDGYTFLNVVGDWIYYTDFDCNNRIGKINKMKLDGSNKMNLISASTTNTECYKYLTIDDNYIYCVYSGENNILFKCKTDGTDVQKLLINGKDSYISELNILGNWIYYKEGLDNINRISKNGGQIENIQSLPSGDMGSNIDVEDNYLYYRSIEGKNGDREISINKMNIKNDEVEKVFNESRNSFCQGEFINIKDGWIYYTQEDYSEELDKSMYGIWKMKIDGSDKKKMISNYIARYSCINVVGDWIYYKYDNDESTYKVKTNGTQNTKV